MELTSMEVLLLNAMRNNEFNDALQEPPYNAIWKYIAIQSIGDDDIAKTAIKSLVEKGLITATNYHSDEDTLSFTKEGAKLFDNAHGKECHWGGKRLLKEIVDKPAKVSYNNTNETKKGMLNMNKEELNEKKIGELKNLAKQYGIKNWWKIKKEDIVTQLLEKMNKPMDEKPESQNAEEDNNHITLQDILNDLEKEGHPIKGAKARRILRTHMSEIQRPFKKWEWDKEEHKDIIESVKKLITK